MQSSRYTFILKITDIESKFSSEEWKSILLDAIDKHLFENGYDSSYKELIIMED